MAGKSGFEEYAVLNTGREGSFSLFIDLTNVPQPTGPVAVDPGDIWNFQCWFRDAVWGCSNLSDGYEINSQ